VSTPAQERAFVLADSTVNALTAARNSLSFAADAADEVDNVLRRSENDIDDLRSQSNRVRDADEPWRPVRNAQELGQDVDRRLRGGRQGLEEVRDHLEQSARAIAAGRSFLAELEELPGRRSATTEQLRYRLESLDRAVHGAVAGVERTDWRLTAARRNVEPLFEASAHSDDRARTAAVINDVGEDVGRDVGHARGAIRTLREDLDNTRPDAFNIAKDTSDLATAIRAGTNPTPQSAQTAPGALGEDPRIAWAEGRDMGQGIDR